MIAAGGELTATSDLIERAKTLSSFAEEQDVNSRIRSLLVGVTLRWATAPELLDAWASLRQALVGPSSTLSPHLKEEVRRTVAQHTGCAYCASLGKPAARQQDEQEVLAVAFAEAVAAEHTAVSGAQVAGLVDAFTSPQVVELLTWISFEYAGQMLGSLIGDEPATAEEREAFAASVVGQPQPGR